ncbi:MAG TPA: DUF1189 family protein [Dissulfurispiraceae bacterium]|nr:DUF1189 family protein [Dissulfurispiraceae bacterium]
MKKFTFTDPLYMAFYAREIYRDVARYWRGAGLLYLLSLAALCTIPGMVKLHSQINAFVVDEAPAYVKQLPTLTISQGILSVPENRPYIIQDPVTSERVLIVDTSGQFQTLEQAKTKVLVTKSRIIVQTGADPVAVQLSQFDDVTLDNRQMFELLEFAGEWFGLAFYPIALAMNYAFRIVQVLIYAFVAMAYGRMLKIALGFGAAMRLTAVALTPMIIAHTLLTFFDHQVPFLWAITFGLSVGYIFFGVRALAEAPSQGAPRQE